MGEVRRAERLGPWGVAAGTIGLVLGSGIARAPGDIAAAFQAPWSLLLWVAGGGLSLLGALVYAECAARRPANGGFHIYYGEAFGPGVAWTATVAAMLVAYPASMAAVAHIFGACVHALAPSLSAKAAGAAGLALVALASQAGLRTAIAALHALTWSRLLLYAGLVVAVLLLRPAEPGMASHLPVPTTSAALTGLLAVLFTFDGWSGISLAGAHGPRTLRRWAYGAAGGVVAVTLLYAFVQWACEKAVGRAALASAEMPLTAAATAALGARGGAVTSAVIGLGCLGALHGLFWTSSRLAEVVLAKPAPAVAPGRGDGGVRGTLLLGALTATYFAISSFQQALYFYAFCTWAFYGLTAVALLVLRRRDGAGPISPLARALPYAFLAGAAVLTFALILQAPAAAVPSLIAWALAILVGRRVAPNGTGNS